MSRHIKIALCLPNPAWQDADQSFQWHMIPHTLCLLAAVVRNFCDVEIIDAHKENLSRDVFMEKISVGRYDLVGVTVLMDLFSQAGHLALSFVKTACPDVVTVMGGVYVTMNPEDAIRDENLDFICIGEGEETFPALIRNLFLGGVMPYRGIGYRKDGKAVIQERALFIEDLDSLPQPAYDLVDFASYTRWYPRKTVDGPELLPYVDIATSRGCPQSCCFCQAIHISGQRVRAKSAERVLNEIQYFTETYGVRSLVFTDDNLVAIRQRASDIFHGMREQGLTMPWKATAMAVFRLDQELLELMAASGCKYICKAIESGSPRVLKEIIHKPIDLEQAKRLTALARSLGIFVAANFIVGFPGETWTELRRTLGFAEELEADYVKIFSAIPLRHTKLWELCKEHDAFAPEFDPNRVSWNKGQIISPHFDDRELTLLRAYEWDRINFSTAERVKKTADMMGISVGELDTIRFNTRRLALDRIAGKIE